MHIPDYTPLDSSIYFRKDEKEIRDKIIVNFLALVKSRMKHFNIELDDMDDVMSEGMVGLISALDHFDPNRGVQFMTFATAYIDGYLKTFFSNKFSYVSLDDEISEDFTRMDMLTADDNIEEDFIALDYKNYQLKQIDTVLDTLPEHHQAVYRELMTGTTIHDVSKQYTLSVEKVKQIMKKVDRCIQKTLITGKK